VIEAALTGNMLPVSTKLAAAIAVPLTMDKSLAELFLIFNPLNILGLPLFHYFTFCNSIYVLKYIPKISLAISEVH
jgi:hypothetical protein